MYLRINPRGILPTAVHSVGILSVFLLKLLDFLSSLVAYLILVDIVVRTRVDTLPTFLLVAT